MVGTRAEVAVGLSLARKGHGPQFKVHQTPIEGQILSSAAMKLFIIREPSKTPKFGLCPAYYLLVFQQFYGPPGVVGHKGKHIRSVSVEPLVKGVDDWLTFPDHGERGSQGAW